MQHSLIPYIYSLSIGFNLNMGRSPFELPAIARAYFKTYFVWQGAKTCIRTQNGTTRVQIRRLRELVPMEYVPDQDWAPKHQGQQKHSFNLIFLVTRPILKSNPINVN